MFFLVLLPYAIQTGLDTSSKTAQEVCNHCLAQNVDPEDTRFVSTVAGIHEIANLALSQMGA